MGKFPFGRGRFCTTYLKQYALRDWYKENLFDGATVYEFWFGMRTQESGQRARRYGDMSSDELFDIDDVFPSRYSKKLRPTIQVRLPIVDWTTEQVFEYLKKNKIAKNPLYSEGTNDRVGCYPCMLAGKKVQQRMLETEVGQERLKIIQQLEKDIGKKYEMYDTDQGSCELCKI
jgi:3'-phosphoadenosine 5'-phosphosulfate sulfotransferase (PAPS reductase)/FAD synthetase